MKKSVAAMILITLLPVLQARMTSSSSSGVGECSLSSRSVIANGNGMFPTIPEKHMSKFDTHAYELKAPKRGDIVAYAFRNKLLVGRIIGTPGEFVSIQDGNLFVSHEKAKETKISSSQCNLQGIKRDYAGNIEFGCFRESIDHISYPVILFQGLMAMQNLDPVYLSKNQYFILSDNRGIPEDSRDHTIGTVLLSKIRGKVCP